MIRVAVTQRVEVVQGYGERRDCLDQNWSKFLTACGLSPLLLPNVPELALALCADYNISGVVLTGGNDLVALGGDAPERDDTERAVLNMAEKRAIPVLGVCRGMQVIQSRYHVPLQRVEGHVTARQTVWVNGEPVERNSYHRYGAFDSDPQLNVWARSEDGVVKAVRHAESLIVGIMWHPERLIPFCQSDIALFRQFFEVTA